MNERFDDGLEFGPNERDAPKWREIWDTSKRYVYGDVAGLVIGLAACLLFTALGVI